MGREPAYTGEMNQAKPLKGDAAAAERHYDRIVEAERARLEQYSPVEFAITRRYLERYVPEGSEVADLGVGVGHYAEFLARRGCRVHLVDVSGRLLEAAQARLRAAGLEQQIASVNQASATDLPWADASMDAMLLLGPLYHLRELEERRKAIQEAWRVLKPGGAVAAGGINRIAFLRDSFRSPEPYTARFFAEEDAQARRTSPGDRAGFMQQYLATGTLDPEHAPPVGYAHLTTITEFRELLTERFEEEALLGAESFTSTLQEEWKAKSEEDRAAWLDVVEATGKTVEGMANSDHF